jgi:glycosyltransferase involved in cell wall biosynthesis
MLESLNKRIAILGDPIDNQRAGIHVYTRELMKALAAQNRNGHPLYLIREKPGGEFPGVQEKAFGNIHHPIGYASFRLFFLIPAHLKKINPDVVIEPAHFGPFNTPRGAKRVTVIHDLTPLKFPQWHRWHSQMLQRLFLPGILNRADLIIVNSKHTQNDLLSLFPQLKKKVKMVYPGINPGIGVSNIDHDWNPEYLSKPFFLYAGTIEPRKRVDQLLKAYELWRRAGKGEQKLVLVGERGWKTTSFDQVLESHPFREDIVLTGYIDDNRLSALYSSCDLFVYPSAYEGFGFPVLEALICGAKVLTARNSSLTEVGGGAVTYFDEQEDIASAIFEKFEEAKRKEITPIEKMRIESFTWEKSAEAYLHLIDAL